MNKTNISKGWYILIYYWSIFSSSLFLYLFSWMRLDCGFLFLSYICQGYSCIIKPFREFLCSLKHFIWQCLSLGFVHFIYVIVLTWISSGDNSLIVFYWFCGCSSVQFYFSFLIVLFFFFCLENNLCLGVSEIYWDKIVNSIF